MEGILNPKKHALIEVLHLISLSTEPNSQLKERKEKLLLAVSNIFHEKLKNIDICNLILDSLSEYVVCDGTDESVKKLLQIESKIRLTITTLYK